MTHHKGDPPSPNPFPVPRSRPVPGTMKTINSLDRFGATRNPEIDPSDGKANVFEKNMFSKKCLFLFHTSITGRSGIFWIILLPYFHPQGWTVKDINFELGTSSMNSKVTVFRFSITFKD